ncbi:hypothetical protein Glove_25g5 [Diversispora epigaea]|uniref:Protein kinase domain-containing protein n=1 Tax=Diversispora epigaea TaxID=1348612 RepID=A0A397JKU7_9GLOM|nr:hypothetical protein Glove_25g5 [Diversispora epigaea]
MNFSKKFSSFFHKNKSNKSKKNISNIETKYRSNGSNGELRTLDITFSDDSFVTTPSEPTFVNSPTKTKKLDDAPKCPTCDGNLTSWDYRNGALYNFWCNTCESKSLQENFVNWTSGNKDIDKLIHDSQLNIGYNMSYLEWIPFDRIENLQEIGKGGFATVYSATWVDGPRGQWNNETKNWDRCGPRKVAVKWFHNSANISTEFLNELKLHSRYFRDSYILQYFGISLYPSTGDLLLILQFANMGNLRNYIQSNPKLPWTQKLDILESIVIGLSQLHYNANLIHKDFHPGNILLSNLGFLGCEPIIMTSISDFGLTKPPNYSEKQQPSSPNQDNQQKPSKNSQHHLSLTSLPPIYGVMPYVAPEALQGHPFSKKSDIFSLAMIMWELSSGKLPFADRPHDYNLFLDICRGIRPDIVPGTPKCFVDLMKSCWISNEFDRPTTQIVVHTVLTWIKEVNKTKFGDIYDQFKEADDEMMKLDKKRKDSFDMVASSSSVAASSSSSSSPLPSSSAISSSQGIAIHPNAIYTSRLLNKFTKYII